MSKFEDTDILALEPLLVNQKSVVHIVLTETTIEDTINKYLNIQVDELKSVLDKLGYAIIPKPFATPFVEFCQGFGQVNQPVDTTSPPEKLPEKIPNEFTFEVVIAGRVSGSYRMKKMDNGEYMVNDKPSCNFKLKHIQENLESGLWEIVK